MKNVSSFTLQPSFSKIKSRQNVTWKQKLSEPYLYQQQNNLDEQDGITENKFDSDTQIPTGSTPKILCFLHRCCCITFFLASTSLTVSASDSSYQTYYSEDYFPKQVRRSESQQKTIRKIQTLQDARLAACESRDATNFEQCFMYGDSDLSLSSTSTSEIAQQLRDLKEVQSNIKGNVAVTRDNDKQTMKPPTW